MRVFMIRHGQAEHNANAERSFTLHSILDPNLTQIGVQQVGAIPQHNPLLIQLLRTSPPHSALILTSPFNRTIETTLTGFHEFLPSSSSSSSAASSPSVADPERHLIPLIILPALQECGAEPCDTGESIEIKRERFPSWMDWSHCVKGWNSNKGFYEANEEKQNQRGKFMRKYIRARTEEVIVVICHHGILRRMCQSVRTDILSAKYCRRLLILG